MSTLLQKSWPITETPAAAPARDEPARTALDRLAPNIERLERRMRVLLGHSINPPMEFDLASDELRGRTLSEAIEALLERADPYVAGAIRQTLADPAALVEVDDQPVRLDEGIDPFLGHEVVSLGVSRAMRGGAI